MTRRSSQSRARGDDSGVDVNAIVSAFADHTRFPVEREGRVQYCMLLMASGRWEKGRTARDIADIAGLALTSVEDISAEASRRVKSALDPTSAREMIAAAMCEGFRQALEMNDPKALQALASLGKVYADVVGAMAPKRHEVTGKDGIPLFPGTNRRIADITDDELSAYLQTGEAPKAN